MNDKEYHDAEMTRYRRDMMRIEQQSLADRQAARADVLENMRDVEGIRAALDHIFAGNYGYAQLHKAKEIIGNKRMNRAAALMAMIGQCDNMCPPTFTVQAYKKLSAEERAALDAAFAEFIENYSDED